MLDNNSWLQGTIVHPNVSTQPEWKRREKAVRKQRRKQMARVRTKARKNGTGSGKAERALRLKWRAIDR